VVQLLNYCVMYPDSTIQYHVSDMVLHISIDDSYLSEAGAHIRTGGDFYLGQKDGQQQMINCQLLVLSRIMKHIMSSAAEVEVEVEVGSISTNAKELALIRVML
jgi:hypothetical protein